MSAARPRRLLSAAAVGALLVPIGPFALSASAAAPSPRSITTACPADKVTSAGYTDIAANTFEVAINCLAKYGIAKGTTATTYSPAAVVTRAQLAVFVERLGVLAGYQFDASPAGFTDIDGVGDEQRRAINGLAHAGIVQGITATTYSPDAAVTRGQVASFLNRLQKAITGTGFTTADDYFTDDAGSVHEADINAIASVGITGGTAAGADTYEPHSLVTRGQMAGFLARLTDIEVAAGKIANAYAVPAGTVPAAQVITAKSVGGTRASGISVSFTEQPTVVDGQDDSALVTYDVQRARVAAGTAGTYSTVTTLQGGRDADSATAGNQYSYFDVPPETGRYSYRVVSRLDGATATSNEAQASYVSVPVR